MMQSTSIVQYLSIWTTVLLGFLVIPSISAPIRASANVVCAQTTWQYILVFYGVNYLAHAGTVPTPAGAKWGYAFQWALTAFCLPYVGLGRSFALIFRRFTLGQKSEIHRALASNALVVLARSRDWKPLEGQEEPPDFHETLKADDRYAHAPGARKIYGYMHPPRGYRWIMVSSDQTHKLPHIIEEKFHLSITQSWLKMCLSIAQLVYSCITIYRSRGDQINHYGYATFGLSVFPFTLMSFTNFACAACVGEYPCVYALTSLEMEEARDSRRGGIFKGAIDVRWQDDELQEVVNGTAKPLPTSAARKPIERKSVTIRTLAMILICGLIIQVPQYLLIYFLTKFQKRQSTLTQRAWMMAWVCANQLIFFPFACISALWPQFLNSDKNRLILFVVMLPLLVAAVGGFVEVGLMMKYSQSCTPIL